MEVVAEAVEAFLGVEVVGAAEEKAILMQQITDECSTVERKRYRWKT